MDINDNLFRKCLELSDSNVLNAIFLLSKIDEKISTIVNIEVDSLSDMITEIRVVDPEVVAKKISRTDSDDRSIMPVDEDYSESSDSIHKVRSCLSLPTRNIGERFFIRFSSNKGKAKIAYLDTESGKVLNARLIRFSSLSFLRELLFKIVDEMRKNDQNNSVFMERFLNNSFLGNPETLKSVLSLKLNHKNLRLKRLLDKDGLIECLNPNASLEDLVQKAVTSERLPIRDIIVQRILDSEQIEFHNDDSNDEIDQKINIYVDLLGKNSTKYGLLGSNLVLDSSEDGEKIIDSMFENLGKLNLEKRKEVLNQVANKFKGLAFEDREYFEREYYSQVCLLMLEFSLDQRYLCDLDISYFGSIDSKATIVSNSEVVEKEPSDLYGKILLDSLVKSKTVGELLSDSNSTEIENRERLLVIQELLKDKKCRGKYESYHRHRSNKSGRNFNSKVII